MNVLTYEKLKQRLDAVVAECATRGEIIERMTGIFGASGYHAVQNSIDPCSALMYDAMQALKSPVAGAALAEVEAKAIEKGIERITIIMNHQAPAVAQVINTLQMYAKALREGRV